MKRILFVCTGNTCRSPMAEGLFNLIARQRGFQGEARSAGVLAADGMPISDHAAEILRERGSEVKAASQPLTREMAEWADLILTMTTGHKRLVIEMFPDAVEKTFALKEFAAGNGEMDAALKEREKLEAELQIKQALNQPISEEEKNRLREMERQLPNCDIADPFGGNLEVYRRCAGEIEQAVIKALARMEEGRHSDAPGSSHPMDSSTPSNSSDTTDTTDTTDSTESNDSNDSPDAPEPPGSPDSPPTSEPPS